MYKIIIDAMGSDNGVEAVVGGTLAAMSEFDDISAVFVGRESEIKHFLNDGRFADRISVVDASDVIEMSEPPVKAIRTKTGSSLVTALNLLKNGQGDALVTAGSTGAAIAGATLIVRRAKNVERAALAPLLPTVKGTWTQLIDCGANVDCKPYQLKQFAIMGSIYMSAIEGIENPKVGLLNNGTEEEKGCALTKETYALLKETEGINFIGNVEAREALSGCCDVIVCDGFTGNILMKSMEGATRSMMSMLKKELTATFSAKIGALFAKKAFYKVKKLMDYKEYGGALLLGINGCVVKAHGDSTVLSFKNAVLQARRVSEKHIVSTITEKLLSLRPE